jgi:RHS repeat-associated protein
MGVSKKVTLDKDQKYTIGYSFKNKMGISANNFVLLELIKDGSIMYTRKLQATEATTFDYTAPATGEYTWRMRSSRIGTTTTQPLTYSLDNLSIFYSYPYTVENCDNLADGYRFGFNGKEDDRETGTQDYGFRIYNPQIGKFLSVDPLTKKYPYYTPYQFAGNMPIKYVDLDGLEPANNPKTPGIKEQKAIAVVDGIAAGAEANNTARNPMATLNPFTERPKMIGETLCRGNNNYVTDTKKESADKMNMYVSSSTVFRVDESNSNQVDNYEAFVVNELMQNFVNGTGPENYEFPTNGIISMKFLESDIFKKAMSAFREGQHPNGASIQYSFGATELYNDTKRNNGNIFNITGLTGSGFITIIQTSNDIKVKIFNITSLSSGDILKIPSNDNTWAKSYVRNPNQTTPYGNISQTFNLALPIPTTSPTK